MPAFLDKGCIKMIREKMRRLLGRGKNEHNKQKIS